MSLCHHYKKSVAPKAFYRERGGLDSDGFQLCRRRKSRDPFFSGINTSDLARQADKYSGQGLSDMARPKKRYFPLIGMMKLK
jgi:hypothetical protein